MKIVFEDTDLEELITTGRNSKYKKYTRNAKFMKALATAYNYMRLVDVASDLRAISFLHYEQLAGTNGMSSIRVINGMVERNNGFKFRRYALWQKEMKTLHPSWLCILV